MKKQSRHKTIRILRILLVSFLSVVLIYFIINQMTFIRDSTFFYHKSDTDTLNRKLCAAAFSEQDETTISKLKERIHDGMELQGMDQNGNTMLHLAASYCNSPYGPDVFILLAETHQIDLNAQNNLGYTPKDMVLFPDCPHCGAKVIRYLDQHGGRHSWKYFFWGIWK